MCINFYTSIHYNITLYILFDACILGVKMLEYEEVKDPYEVEEIADAISHHIRYMILMVLRKHRSMSIGDLIRELERKFDVKITHGNIRVHLMKMALLGIVDMIKIDGKDAVILKKDIKLYMKEVEK